MGKLKRAINGLRWNWPKFLVTAVVLVVVAVVLNNDSISPWVFIGGAVVAALAAIGFVAMLLEKLGVLGKNIAKGAKKIGQSASKAFGGGQKTAKKQASKDDDIVTLLSAKGEEIDFVEIAGIAYRGNFYAILQPVELLDGMDDDEALVFKVSRGRNGEDKFEIELDDSIVSAVFREYDKLYAQAHNKR